MFGHKHDAHDDDEDIQIVDLDTSDTSDISNEGMWHRKNWRLSVSTTPSVNVDSVNDNDEQQGHSPAMDVKRRKVVYSPLTPRFSSRQRYGQVIVTTAFVILVLSVLLFQNMPTRSKILSMIAPLTQKSTPTKSDYFYIAASPHWGHLFVDGKLVAHPSEPATNNSTPLMLTRGHHIIRWDAPPFTSQSCAVSKPPDPKHDTCLYNQYVATSSDGSSGAWLFVFRANLTHLEPPLDDQLLTTIQWELDGNAPTTTVLPGEAYAIASYAANGLIKQQVRVAHVPLKATLHYQLNTGMGGGEACSNALELNIPCVYAGQDCHILCSTQFFPDRSNVWDVLAVVQATWTYTTMSGQVVAQGQPEIVDNKGMFGHLLPLRITWDGLQWHATLSSSMLPVDMQQFFDLACNTAMNHERIDPTQRYVAMYHLSTSWRFVSEPNSAIGCLGMATLIEGENAPPDASLPVAYCLHRFGLFIAANATAHKYWPNLPVADAYEQHLAQQLAASYQQVE